MNITGSVSCDAGVLCFLNFRSLQWCHRRKMSSSKNSDGIAKKISTTREKSFKCSVRSLIGNIWISGRENTERAICCKSSRERRKAVTSHPNSACFRTKTPNAFVLTTATGVPASMNSPVCDLPGTRSPSMVTKPDGFRLLSATPC